MIRIYSDIHSYQNFHECHTLVHIEEHCAYWTYAHCTTILPSITTQFEDVLASPAPAPVPPLPMSYVFWMVHITNSFQISMSKVYFWYFWVLFGTSRYFWVLTGNSRYFEVLLSTLRYLWGLWGTSGSECDIRENFDTNNYSNIFV